MSQDRQPAAKAILLCMILVGLISCVSDEVEPRPAASATASSQAAPVASPSDFFQPNTEKQIKAIQDELIPALTDIQVNGASLTKLSQFFPLVDSSLTGMDIRDSLLMYMSSKHDDELRQLIIDYIKSAKPQNRADLEELIFLHDHRQDYEYTGFCFSTVLYRLKVFELFTILLPKTDWKTVFENGEQSRGYIAGNDSNSGMLMFKVKSIAPNYDILSDPDIQGETSIVLRESPLKSHDSPELRFPKGPVTFLAKNVKAGAIRFKAVYDRVTTSPNESTYQTLVEYTRYYITNEKLYSITLFEILSYRNVQADKKRLPLLLQRLLDSVYFLEPVGDDKPPNS